LAVFASALALSACGSSNETPETVATEEIAEVATSETCAQVVMMAKAEELGMKMQILTSDPEAMQEMAGKMQAVQEQVQQGAANRSFGIAEACAGYHEMLAD
jgi:hypothetical protein